METIYDKKWNFSECHYTQMKVAAPPGLASAFKKACAASDVSMRSVLMEFMADYCKINIDKKKGTDYSTRGLRRAAIEKITQQLCWIRDAEEEYRDRIPENLQGSVVYDNADETVAFLDEAIENLLSAY